MPETRKHFLLRLNASHYLAIGFILLIFIGGLILNLPFASLSGESPGFLNALFTATSAACVTGQVVVTTAAQWSNFGRVVIITLIQIGGIGVITLVTVAMKMLNLNITMRERLTIQAAFGQDEAGGMEKLIINVIKVTFAAEAVGAVLLTIGFYTASEIKVSFGQALTWGVFHSISAFCNAGFDIIGENNMMPYAENPIINLTLMCLIAGGGIGFPVWVEICALIKKRLKEKLPLSGMTERLSIHAKVVLSVTGTLIAGGALLFLLLEWDNPQTLAPLSLPGKIMASFFQSVTLRTAGFSTINQAGLNGSSHFLSCLLMVIGGSPAGTAGGIKTVTLGIIMFSMFNAARGREQIVAFKRNFTLHDLQKALTLTAMLFLVVISGAMVLRFTEHNNPFPHTFLDLLFECSSVSATVGLTTGITPYLSNGGKVVLIVSMFIGRLGPTTIAMALTSINKKADLVGTEMSYPDAELIIG
ncbi:MAG: Trk family potassium uptake protein [Clostridiales bacterium]|jgi:trk system potassium uptake protein TrkH|nr:Trk family potassium uptake protein [Clostridiales bacterium]